MPIGSFALRLFSVVVVPALCIAESTPAITAPSTQAVTSTLVVCAPGYPGDTTTAQPTMDSFAKIAAEAASWPAGSLSAMYFETAQGGLERLAAPDAAFALVSLPFFLQHESDLKLAARLQVKQESGSLETWSLAARRGKVHTAEGLDGWQIIGSVGYSPEFVRGPVLGGWGPVPASARITFTASVLSALRRAAAGESVAVILDGAQAKGLASLPFGADLEIVARSMKMPGTILCTVGKRLSSARAEEFVRGLERLDSRPEWAQVLKSMRMVRFEAVDVAGLGSARQSFAKALGPGRAAP